MMEIMAKQTHSYKIKIKIKEITKEHASQKIQLKNVGRKGKFTR